MLLETYTTDSDMTDGDRDKSVENSVCFRVMGMNLDPQSISESLQLTPTQQHKRGEANTSSSGREYGKFAESLWALDSPLNSESSVDSHVKSLVAELAGKEHLVARFNEDGLRADFFVGIVGIGEAHGFRLSSEAVEGLARLNLAIEFDVYS